MAAGDIYIGLMSGTSIDSVDAVAVRFPDNGIEILGSCSRSIPTELRSSVLTLCHAEADNVQLLAQTDHLLGQLFAAASNQLISSLGVNQNQIAAIGCHGQTVRHAPPGQSIFPFTLQIGDPNMIAAITGCIVAADFRRKDMALGGQGAPLVPAFHRYLFKHGTLNRAIINIGGIANITWLPSNGECLGFDTGPGNVLMDAWCQLHKKQPFDDNGSWASSGRVDKPLLEDLKCHSYFSSPIPKSTGRELFNLAWLESYLKDRAVTAEDVQATLLALTTETIGDALDALEPRADEVYLCGGGAFNATLKNALSARVTPATLDTTSALGLDPKLVECCAFAWLARQRLLHLPGNLPSVTGAARQSVLGGLYVP